MKKVKNDSEYLNNLRHSAAHLLAKSVKELWPGTHNAIGPSIENGFYQDFDFGDVKISDSDLPKIEEKMREILKSWNHFEFNEVSIEEAKKLFKDNPYKLELIEEFAKDGKRIQTNNPGNFLDLCKMGHVEKPKEELKNFKLLSIAGAYWRGNEKNKMLTRIYGTAFPSQQELDDYLKLLEESKKRDHRKLGVELDLYSISPLVGPGLILWHPKLSRVRNVVEQFWKDIHYQEGYQLVFTPHISSMDMFVISRHLSKYIDFMFPIMMHEFIEGESAPDYKGDEVLKPMNCPGHVQIYKAHPRSYRELPIRIGELGTVYRYERAGVLHGMTRVRGFTQDDSHIFCRPDQVKDEVRKVLRLTKKIYELFGFQDYHVYLSTRPEKYLGDLAIWEFAQNSLKEVLIEEKIPFDIDEGSGAFYGPKIDSKVKDSLGREWQLGTIQFDFNQPDKKETTKEEIEEFWNLKAFKHLFKSKDQAAKYLNRLGRGFDVTFVNSKGEPERVVMIHRVIFGALERFFGILIEHYGGAFPSWLAPVQAEIIPISDRHVEFAKKVKEELEKNHFRVEIDGRTETMQAKIRDAQNQKVPYMLIMGDKEQDQESVAVRTREKGNIGMMKSKEFIQKLREEVDRKSLQLMEK
ncbi:threonine--tRNA ligase [Candidatus Microgenomates bacterium]|nr:threonine--tRNA ligase [Candidatus Microgenomates bacterium]